MALVVLRATSAAMTFACRDLGPLPSITIPLKDLKASFPTHMIATASTDDW